MIFRVPIYVAATPGGGFTARPLFFAQPVRSDAVLNRLVSKLARDVTKVIEECGKEPRHDEAARWTFSPTLTQHRLAFTFDLRRRTAKAKYLLVAFRHLGKRLAFTPSVPGLWFEVERGADLQARAADVLHQHWATREREDGEVFPEAVTLTGKAWVQTLEVSARMAAKPPQPSKHKFMSLGGDAPADGAAELARVGRCLDWLYPDELDRALLRDREVEELSTLLAAKDRRPVMLVGPRQSGKTTLLHEVTFRRVAARRSPFVDRRGVWLLSPQRLISGMMFVGQWEDRLLAILKHARKRDHVLYFDDLVGLFHAGVSASSTLNVAQVLKPYMERRDVRIVGEITPEALRVLRERDRSFADLFHVIPVREPGDADALRILVGVQRRLETKHKTGFDLDVLPAVIDLQRRYNRSAAFPGKAARMLTRLAVKADPGDTINDHAGPFDPPSTVTRDTTLKEFQSQSGLSIDFLDRRARLDRDDILKALAIQVVGQDEALDAAADAIAVAKARLNDPDRPLAAFLFLGPTGVGKTESAKAVARYLFGDADRLLRFDMNEYVNPGSAARLVGTFDQPEGLLTAAVRRQPFAVVLLDEIEKADGEVFDLLLQVLGEGRLTDAHGRTADFTNALIVMTSNLGVREASAVIGFRDGETAGAHVRAAEAFFRPEFFNRLDRVIPFRRLTREHTRAIASRLVSDVLAREGFRQRRCVLNVSPAALERVVEAGYDPVLGARAMKRSVERQVAQPAAGMLAGVAIDRFTVVNVLTPTEAGSTGETLSVDVRGLDWAEQLPPSRAAKLPPIARLDAVDAELDRIEEGFASWRPKGTVSGKQLTAAEERYFAVRELADSISDEWERLHELHSDDRLARMQVSQPVPAGRRSRYRVAKVEKLIRRNGLYETKDVVLSAQTLEESMRDLARESEPEAGDADIIDLERRVALLRLMATCPDDDRPVYLWIRGHPSGASYDGFSMAGWYHAWDDALGIEVERLLDVPGVAASDAILVVRGLHARPLALTEAGTHLICPPHGTILPIRVDVLDKLPPAVPDPFAFGPVVRTYLMDGTTIDARTGLVVPTSEIAASLSTFTLAALERSP